MKYYINNKKVNYTIFEYYLKKSIIYQCNFTLKNEEFTFVVYLLK